ncbi:GH-E family nuclease [Saccharopolyspora thermophila]|uniref:GH-E family nuclease n=1 Tax=Saccharopolyspora thermophila TaxID=89367 RepID=UPI0031F9F40D
MPRPRYPDGSAPNTPGTRTDAPNHQPTSPSGPGQRPDGNAPGSPKSPDPAKTPDSTKTDPTKAPDGDKAPDSTKRPDADDAPDRPKDATESQSGPDAPKDGADKPNDPDADKPEPGTPEYDQKINDGVDNLKQTDAGVSGHTDPNMQDLASRVPNDGKHFTVDAHHTPDGLRIGGRNYSPDELADVLRRSGWDGKSPIRLISCDSGDFASDLAKKLGVDVTAPNGKAWSDGSGNVFSSSTAPDGGPTWPPDGGWETHSPDGTKAPASDDGFHPSRNGEDPGERPDDAQMRDASNRLPEEEIDKRQEALPEKYYLYDGGREARLRSGESGPPLRWDENANDGNGAWVEREGTLEPTPDTPDHLRDDNKFMEYVYEGKRPAFSASTKYAVYRNTEMNVDGSYRCAVSDRPIPVVKGPDGNPQFYKIVGEGADQRRVETSPPDWYLRDEEPPAPPHEKFTLPEPGVSHMGHENGYEYWRQRHFALNHEMTIDQYEQMYDHPGHYRLELKEENEAHGHESTDAGYGHYPELYRNLFPNDTLTPIRLAPTDEGEIVKGTPKLGDPRR